MAAALNKRLVGNAIRGRRDVVVPATEFGNRRNAPDGRTVDGRPEYVRKACGASLERLGVEVIDLYYQHRVDPQVPIEDTVGTMAELVREGKIRFLGLSEAGPATIRRAADRTFGLDPRRGVGDSAVMPGAGRRLRRLQPAGQRFSYLDSYKSGRSDGKGSPPRPSPDFTMKTWRETAHFWSRSSRSRRSADAAPLRLRSPGCWGGATTLFRSPAPSGAVISRRTSGHLMFP